MELFPQGSKPLTGVSPLVKALGGEVGHFLRRDGKIVNLAAQTNLTFQWRQILLLETNYKYTLFSGGLVSGLVCTMGSGLPRI